MTTTTLTQPTRPTEDLRHRLQPSREQLRMAAAMFRVATEDVTSVVVPVVVPDAVVPAQRTGLQYPGGYWLADRSSRDGAYSYRAAREAAEAAARAHVETHGHQGVPGWVSIRPDGSWSALDGA